MAKKKTKSNKNMIIGVSLILIATIAIIGFLISGPSDVTNEEIDTELAELSDSELQEIAADESVGLAGQASYMRDGRLSSRVSRIDSERVSARASIVLKSRTVPTASSGVKSQPTVDILSGCTLDELSWGVTTTGSSTNFHQISGVAENAIFALGDGEVFRFDGISWKKILDSTSDRILNGIYVNSINDVWVVGVKTKGTNPNSGDIILDDKDVVLRWNGVQWQDKSTGLKVTWTKTNSHGVKQTGKWGYNLNEIWGTTNGMYAVGSGPESFSGKNVGKVLHYDGTVWKEIFSTWDASGTGQNDLLDIWGTSPSDIYVVGLAGQAYHFDGNNWIVEWVDKTGAYDSVGGTSSNNIYTTGSKTFRKIVDWQEISKTYATQPLKGVWGKDGNVFFATNNYDPWKGVSPIAYTTGNVIKNIWAGQIPDVPYNDVWGLDKDNLFVVGQKGAIVRSWCPK